jgi:uncharacterized protein (UPF0335 family)
VRRNCLLKHVIDGKIEGRIEVTERRERRRKQLLDDLKEMEDIESTKSQSLENSIRKKLWTFRKTDYGTNL